MIDPRRWARLKELFFSASELGPADREEFVRDLREEDPEIVRRLRALLSAHDRTGGFVQAAIGGEAREVLDEASLHGMVGRRFGPYEVVGPLGRGGMGAVFLAKRADGAFEKQVAIKVVAAAFASEDLLRRFSLERQTLAQFEHPNIARLLDGGVTPDGVPYLVMEHVEGKPIDRYCDETECGLAERLRLFLDVGAAVQHAHRNLVVHRDLKPSNILVTADGTVKLLDFGIAKLLAVERENALRVTGAAEAAFTPEYASPEQVRGEPITTATDVYALGVLLYRLLSGTHPYDFPDASLASAHRVICEEEPRPPSEALAHRTRGPAAADAARAARRIRGDLDNIALKALQKEPQRRYATVEKLSEDLRRHIEGLPVSAHRDSWTYRTRKFARRHRAGVAAGGLVAVALLAGIVATTREARVARAERARAERQFDDVRRLANSLLFEFHSAIQDLPGSTPARRLLVQRALEYLTKLTREAADDPGLQREMAEAYLKVGDVQGNPYAPNLGDTAGAARSYERAVAIGEALTRSSPKDLEARRILARSYKSAGEVLPLLGRPSDGAADLRKATEIFETLTVVSPADEGLRGELANCYQVLGDLLGHSGVQNLGDAAGALESYRAALAIYVTQDAKSTSARRGVAVLQMRIGDLRMARDDLRGAMDGYREARDILEGLSVADPTNADLRRLLALSHRKVGGLQEVLGDVNAALASYARAATENEALMRADATNAQASMNLAITLRYTADLLDKIGQRSRALVQYRRLLTILERLSSAEPENVLVSGRLAETLVLVGSVLFRDGRPDEARRMTSRGLDMTRKLAALDDATPDDLSQYSLSFLTCEPADLRDRAFALSMAQEAVSRSGGTDSDGLDVLAQAFFQNGDAARAVATEEKALRLLGPAGAPGSPTPTRNAIEAHLREFQAAKGDVALDGRR